MPASPKDVAVEADAGHLAAGEVGRQATERRRVAVDDGDRVAEGLEVLASAEPTRPQPMMTTCTACPSEDGTAGAGGPRTDATRAPCAGGAHRRGCAVPSPDVPGANDVAQAAGDRPGAAQRPAERAGAAQAPGAADLRQRPAVARGVRHPGDAGRPDAGRPGLSLPHALPRGLRRAAADGGGAVLPPAGAAPIRAAAATTRWPRRTSAQSAGAAWSPARCWSTTS